MKVNNPASLRHMDHAYTWYSTDAGVNGGVPGSLGVAAWCNGTLEACNTQAYVDAVNALGLCGHDDWRLPTPQELLDIVHYGRFGPAIDPVYFVNTASGGSARSLWTGWSWAPDALGAWIVFGSGFVLFDAKSNGSGVRLVRAGP